MKNRTPSRWRWRGSRGSRRGGHEHATIWCPPAGAATQAASAVAAHETGPFALDRALARLDGMADALVLVKPETVIA